MIEVDAEAVGDAVAAIYCAAYDGAEWSATIERLRLLFRGSKACLIRVGPDLVAADRITAPADPSVAISPVMQLSPEADGLDDAMTAASGGLVHANGALGLDRLKGGPFWTPWMAPQDAFGGIACKLLTLPHASWFFDVQRGPHQPAFAAADLDLLTFLAPHIRRAVEIGRKLAIHHAISAAAANLSFGLFLVDANLRVLGTNEAADAILRLPESPVRTWNGRLRCTPRTLETLSRLVRDVYTLRPCGTPGRGGDVVAHADAGCGEAASLAISVGPSVRQPGIEPHAVLLVRDLSLKMPAAFVDQAREAFDLTPKEAQVAAALATGISLKQVAQNGGIAITTARTHLDRIFRKTATRQQSELVALLKTLQPLTG